MIEYEKIPEMLANGMVASEIADHFGTTPGSLAVQCSKRKISLCPPGGKRRNRNRAIRRGALDQPLTLSESALLKLQEKARQMHMHPANLARQLIEVIVKDDLFAAVLDVQQAA